jgi:hypothetical protein
MSYTFAEQIIGRDDNGGNRPNPISPHLNKEQREKLIAKMKREEKKKAKDSNKIPHAIIGPEEEKK